MTSSMSGSIIVELKPSSELMLLGDAMVRAAADLTQAVVAKLTLELRPSAEYLAAIDRLSAAIESATRNTRSGGAAEIARDDAGPMREAAEMSGEAPASTPPVNARPAQDARPSGAPVPVAPIPEAPPSGSSGVAVAALGAAAGVRAETPAPATDASPVAGATMRNATGRPARQLTDARKAMLAETYPAGVDIQEIKRRWDELPGVTAEVKLITAYAIKMGLKRPEGFMADLYRGTPTAERGTPTAERGAGVTTISKNHWCTPAREKVLREMFPAGDLVEMLGVLRRQIGGTVPNWAAVQAYATDVLGLVRTPKPASEKPSALARAMTPPTPVAPVARGVGGAPIEAEFDQVARWAGDRGILFTTWEDLPRVNDKRERLGIPTFKRKLPGRSVHRTAA